MILLQIFVFLLVITAIVVAHELGHYLFARWRGMEVEEFCILGLPVGRRFVLGRTRSGMEITMHPFMPLGGFVKIKGMEPRPDASETRIEGGFYSKGLGSRALVLFGGPLFSILFGWFVLFLTLWAFGDARPAKEPVIGAVLEKYKDPETKQEMFSPAYKAGLREGDKLISVDGKPISNFYDFLVVTRSSPGKTLKVVVERDGKRLTLSLEPVLRENMMIIGPDGDPELNPDGTLKRGNVGWIGALYKIERVDVGFRESAYLATKRSWQVIINTYGTIINWRRVADEVGGPISIGQIVGGAVQSGVETIATVTALISLSIGLINLLPVPMIFDGGHLLVVLIEALRGGKRLSFKTQEMLSRVGIAMLAFLLISVLFLDVKRIFD
ncbi:MAG TPA: M50 family metallopeptidase [Fimbriimonadales bacterium]|nr:M50 family metallopeptidase [Fimbriimonadales bacterium]